MLLSQHYTNHKGIKNQTIHNSAFCNKLNIICLILNCVYTRYGFYKLNRGKIHIRNTSIYRFIFYTHYIFNGKVLHVEKNLIILIIVKVVLS